MGEWEDVLCAGECIYLTGKADRGRGIGICEKRNCDEAY